MLGLGFQVQVLHLIFSQEKPGAKSSYALGMSTNSCAAKISTSTENFMETLSLYMFRLFNKRKMNGHLYGFCSMVQKLRLYFARSQLV